MSESKKNTVSEEPSSGATRREFLKTAGAGAATGLIALSMSGAAFAEPPAGYNPPKVHPKEFRNGALKPRTKMASGRVLGANERINIAHIGVGGQGSYHVSLFCGQQGDLNTRSIAVSDIYTPRMERNKETMLKANPGITIQTDKDYRALIDNKDVDAVIVATPEHWHAQATIDALQAGKHVYCEKPFTRYLDEAFTVYDMQKRTGKIVQVGSQGTSDVKWHVAGAAVTAGKIGQIVSCQGSYARNSKDGEWNYDIDAGAGPDNLDWKMWLGSAPDRPWNDDSKARFFRYRKYRDYSAGLLGDLMPHKLHPLMIALFLDKPEWPLHVTALGTRKISTDREVADTIQVLTEFPSGHTMLVYLSTVNEQGIEDVIRGHRATIRFGGHRVQIAPERPYAEEIDPEDLPVEGPGETIEAHHANWIDCIRTNKAPNCNVDLATRVQAIVSMAEMSELTNKTVSFDEKTRKMTV
ncbi:MAG TPA: Gfo/Idh/MocA family oxidoreductase [Armatimonadota bacterium]|jgi:predicted dehydrogenase